MRRGRLWVWALGGVVATVAAIAACVGNDPTPGSGPGDDGGGAGTDGATTGDTGVGPGADGGGQADADAAAAVDAQCDPNKPFVSNGFVSELNAKNSVGNEDTQARLSPDELTVYWLSARDGGRPLLTSATRTSKTGAFGPPTVLNFTFGQLQNPGAPSPGPDPATIFFNIYSAGNPNSSSIFKGVYAGGQWGIGDPNPYEALGLGKFAVEPYLTPDGLDLVFAGSNLDGGGNFVLYEMTRPSTGAEFSDANRKVIAGLDVAAATGELRSPVLSADKLWLYFAVGNASPNPIYDIWFAHRPTVNDPFQGPAALLGVNNSGADNQPSWISGDQCTLLFYSSYPGYAVKRAGRLP